MAHNSDNTDFQVTNNPDLFDKQYGITPELKNQLDDLRILANSGKKSGIKKLESLIEKHPQNPQLKNFLVVLYSKMGQYKKAYEVNRQIVDEHPDYFFGLANLVAEYLGAGEPEKVKEVFGESLTLKGMYPNRDMFHISEVLFFFFLLVKYYVAIDELDIAESYCEKMNMLDPDHSHTKNAYDILRFEQMESSGLFWDEDEGDYPMVKDISEAIDSTETNPPVFTHKEIEELYKYDLNIDKDLLRNILQLPRETVIKDLELVLSDSIRRFNWFNDVYNAPNDSYDFVLHALFLLSELKSYGSLPVFLKVLSQHNEYYDLFFGDIITDLTWPAYYVIATNQLEVLKDYMMKPGVYTFSKEVVNHVVEQLALHQPERKEEVVQWYRDVLSFYNSASLEDNVIDGTLLAFMAGSLVKVCGEETESIIKPLFDKGYVNLSVSGDLKSTIKYLKNGEPEVLNNMFDHYDYYSTMWQDDSWDDEDEDSFLDEEFDDYPFYYKQQQPVVNGPKIERNDPCPCGSGKKYKKCCLK